LIVTGALTRSLAATARSGFAKVTTVLSSFFITRGGVSYGP
jgi:hypothetical protein